MISKEAEGRTNFVERIVNPSGLQVRGDLVQKRVVILGVRQRGVLVVSLNVSQQGAVSKR